MNEGNGKQINEMEDAKFRRNDGNAATAVKC